MSRPTLTRTSWFRWMWLSVCVYMHFGVVFLLSCVLVTWPFHWRPRGPASAWIPGLVSVIGMASVVIQQMRKREHLAFRNACDLRVEDEVLIVRAGDDGRVVAEIPAGTLAGANLSGYRLKGASFWSADLRSADLSRADLSEAWLREAMAEKASFQGANLRRADLVRADLRGADLRGADLRDASLSGTNLDGARYDRATRWPRGFRPAVRNCIHDPVAERTLPIPVRTSSGELPTLPIAADKQTSEGIRVETRA